MCTSEINLDGLPLFRGLTPAEIALLQKLFIPTQASAGAVLFPQGGPAENLYIVVEGDVCIRYKPDDGPELTVTTVHSGGVVGWSAALGARTYTSSALCNTDCLMLCISGNNLRGLCEQHPDTGRTILERLANVIAERLRNTHQNVLALLEKGVHMQFTTSVGPA